MNFTDQWRARFQANTSRDPDSGCWIWQRALGRQGYGLAHGPERKMALAHRLAFRAWVGEIPAGLQLDHLCRTPACVNPAHLEPVTREENMRRAVAARTHCKYGHEFSPENTRTTANGHRQCLTCKRDYEREYYHRTRRNEKRRRTRSQAVAA